MIDLDSPDKSSLRDALDRAVDNADITEWRRLLRDDFRFLSDPLSLISKYWDRIYPKIGGGFSFPTINRWLTTAQIYSQKVVEADFNHNNSDLILYEVWEHLSKQLRSLLKNAKERGVRPISDSGYLVLFACGLSKHIFIEYRFSREAINFRVVKATDSPRAFFNLSEVSIDADWRLLSDVKSLLNSGQKILIHRGVLVHVDSRFDVDVFGPTIDTLVIAELLAQQIFENPAANVTSGLEIGCGNGLLSCAMSTHATHAEEIYALDNHFGSIACTNENISHVQRCRGQSQPDIVLIHGRFRPELFNRKFDLIVCNPPYVPLHKDFGGNPPRIPERIRAVGGTELLENVIRRSADLLESGGRGLVLTSHLSLDEAINAIPSNVSLERPFGDNGYEVRFEVEKVLDDAAWSQYLIDERGLIKRGGSFFHNLHALWLVRA